MTPEDAKVIVVGDNHYWGKADTIEEARKLARSPKYYVVYVAHPDSTVNELGGITAPSMYRPKVILRKLPKGRTV